MATAKVSTRLVPDQDPEEIGNLLQAHLTHIALVGVRAALTRMHGAHAWTARLDNPFARAAARALEKAFGVLPLFTREGGSNPIVPTFERGLNAPVVMFPLGLPDDQPHAPNERLDLETFQRGIIACAHLYGEIGSACT
jgi:acetylornithine deacetylase/succinyl-diaminopimelate desuccinylase-like protein